MAWIGTFVLTVLDWRNGKSTRPRDPPFTHPEEPTELDEEESLYEQPSRKSAYENSNSSQSPFSDNNRYSGVPSVGPSTTSLAGAPQLPRQSFDAYGAFSDPAPSGFAAATSPPPFAPPISPPPDASVSRTMQYADPYARVRSAVTQNVPAANPPTYQPYSGYQ